MAPADPDSGDQIVDLEHFGDDNLVIESIALTIGPYYVLSCYDPVGGNPIYLGLNQTMRLACFLRMEV